MSHLLYLRGEPGSGKHTIGQMAACLLGWSYLWFHDLYRMPKPDPVAIARTVIPELARHMAGGESLVFTRPSRLRSTVEAAAVLASHCGYGLTVVRLQAGRAELLRRVSGREACSWRVSDAAGLDEYLREGGAEDWPGEVTLRTDQCDAKVAAEQIVRLVRLEARVKTGA